MFSRFRNLKTYKKIIISIYYPTAIYIGTHFLVSFFAADAYDNIMKIESLERCLNKIKPEEKFQRFGNKIKIYKKETERRRKFNNIFGNDFSIIGNTLYVYFTCPLRRDLNVRIIDYLETELKQVSKNTVREII